MLRILFDFFFFRVCACVELYLRRNFPFSLKCPTLNVKRHMETFSCAGSCSEQEKSVHHDLTSSEPPPKKKTRCNLQGRVKKKAGAAFFFGCTSGTDF